MSAEQIPDIVIARLPIYLRALTHLAEEGQKLTTSSHELGRHLGISSAQIRKDLSHFGEFGKQGTGYQINYLIEQLRQILKLDREWGVAIIGAGYLGHALAKNLHSRLQKLNRVNQMDEAQMKDFAKQHRQDLAALQEMGPPVRLLEPSAG